MCFFALPIVSLALMSVPTTQQDSPNDFQNPGWWQEYVGDIDGKLKIGLTLRVDHSGTTATGTYYYARYCKDIRITAQIDGRAITIQEFGADGRQTGTFRGEFVRVDPRNHFHTTQDLQREVITGKWTRSDGTGERPFYLCMDHATFSSSNRYAGAGADDDASVDACATRFCQAILEHKPAVAASMLDYPLRVRIDRGDMIEIRDARQFTQKFDQIFDDEYRRRLAENSPTHMFCNYKGICFGRGEFWIGVGPDGKLRVIAINN